MKTVYLLIVLVALNKDGQVGGPIVGEFDTLQACVLEGKSFAENRELFGFICKPDRIDTENRGNL